MMVLEESKKKNRKIILLICMIGLIIVMLGVIIFFLFQNFSSQNLPVATTISTEGKISETVKADGDSIVEATDPPEAVSVKDKPNEEGYTISKNELEEEIERIRTYYYTPSEEDHKVVLQNGDKGWNYSRDYRYHNGKLVFAFIFDGTEEHRLYFKDDHMIRYIDEYGVTYDYPDTKKYSDWEQKALDEAYSSDNIEDIAETDDQKTDVSKWLGTWSAENGENLEIYDANDGGLMLRFNKYSEAGNKISIVYPLEFDNNTKTIASEFENAHDYGWEYTFILNDGYITVKSRYPDQFFYKE